MSQGIQRWPQAGRTPESIKDHGDTITTEINLILEYARDSNKNVKKASKDIPAKVYEPLFKSIQTFIRRATKPDTNERVQREELYDMVKDIHTNIQKVQHRLDTPSTQGNPKLNNTRSWAQMVGGIALPPSVQSKISNGTGLAPSNCTTIEDFKHKEVVMRRTNNRAVIEGLRKADPIHLRELLNAAIKRANIPTVNNARFTAAKINARGSIVAHTETASQAEALRIHRAAWAPLFAGDMEVMVPTYPVLVHAVPIKSIDLTRKDELFQLFSIENPETIGNHRLIDARWLKRYKEGQRDGSLIIDCETPEGANALIRAGRVVWRGGLKLTKKCDPECQFLRCLKCYRYGKCKGTYCTNPETCGKCASTEHNSNDCQAREKKCALCGGPHPAWSQTCREYKKEQQRVEAAKVRLEIHPYFAEPARNITPGPSELSSSRESSQANTGSTRNSSRGGNSTIPSSPIETEEISIDLEGDLVIGDGIQAAVRCRKRKTANSPRKETEINPKRNARGRSASPTSRKTREIRARSKSKAPKTNRGTKETPLQVYEDWDGDSGDSDQEGSNLSRSSRSSRGGRPRAQTNPAPSSSRTPKASARKQ